MPITPHLRVDGAWVIMGSGEVPGTGTEPVIQTTELNSMVANVPFAQAVIIQGEAPFDVSVSAGDVPSGLTVDPYTAFVHGTPIEAAGYEFVILVENDIGSDTQTFSGTIADDVEPPIITTTSLDPMTVGEEFSQQIEFTGDTPIAFDESSGVWPDGIAMSTSGFVNGTPTTEETGSVTARATNDAGSDTQVLGWTVDPAEEPATALHVLPDIPFSPLEVGTDGGGSCITANRFYSVAGVSFKVLGVRLQIPTGATGAILTEALTFYGWAEDWDGTALNGLPSVGVAAQTKAYTTIRTAGTYIDVLFDTPFTIVPASSSTGVSDVVTLGMKSATGDLYIYASAGDQTIDHDPVESINNDDVYFAEDPFRNGANSFGPNAGQGYWYGIDLLYEVVV